MSLIQKTAERFDRYGWSDPSRHVSLRIMSLIIMVILTIDQVTKLLAFNFLRGEHEVVLIPGFLQLRYVTNTGAAFSMFTGMTLTLTVFSVIISGFLLYMAIRLPSREYGLRTAIGLILGGAVGNLVDRVRLHEVIDFIDVHWMYMAHWPTFNIADSAVCAGMFLWVVTVFRTVTETCKEEVGAAATSSLDTRNKS